QNPRISLGGPVRRNSRYTAASFSISSSDNCFCLREPGIKVPSLRPSRNRISFLRSRKNEILFLDGRKLGTLIPGSRKQKQLSDEEIEKLAAVYREFRRTGPPKEIRGFC